MSRLTIQQCNFTAGELSPRLAGRTDIDRYPNAAKTLTNALPVRHGGVRRRPGTLYYKATKVAAKTARLVPFVVNRDTAYMLEFGDTYVRVHGAGGVDLGIEVTSPYTEAQLPDIDWAQGADTMFLSHPDVVTSRMRRFDAATFLVDSVPFTVQPFAEQGHAPTTTATLSATTVGAGRTITAGAAAFKAADVGRTFVVGAGQAVITAFTDTTHVTATVTVAFANAVNASGTWKLDGSPQALIRPMTASPVQSTCNVYAGLTRSAGLTLSAKTGVGVTVTADAAIFSAADAAGGILLIAGGGIALVTGYTDTTHITVSIYTDSPFESTTYTSGAWGMSATTWRAEDGGKYIRVNGGLLQIVATSTPGITGGCIATILTPLTSTVVAPVFAWTLEANVWSATNGYPRAVALHEQRLVLGGSAAYPQTIWGSRTAEYLDNTPGVNDDDAYSFTLSSEEVNSISHMQSLRNLVVHTYGGEFSMQGGIEKPITPTNVRARPESKHGSKRVRPEKIGSESVFVQRSGLKVRSLGYSYQNDAYVAPDLVVFSEHITTGGVTALSYAQEPEAVLWGVRADGALLSCTLDREQGVTAWVKHYTDGAIESVATIPNGSRDETWVIVKRTVNGATVRYIEILDDTFAPALPGAPSTAYPPVAAAKVYGTTVDCGKVFDNALGQTTFSVPHLIGKTVDIIADGSVMERQVVPGGGSITIARAAYRTLIGLPFVPTITLLTPEVGTGTGSAQGNSMRTSELTLKFLDTLWAEVTDGEGRAQDIGFTQLGDGVVGAAPAPFTGEKRIEMLGWERGRSEITITQDKPLPLHLLAAIRKFQVND